MAGMAQVHCWPAAALTGRNDLCLKRVPRGMLDLGVREGVVVAEKHAGKCGGGSGPVTQAPSGLVVSCSPKVARDEHI